MRKVTFKIIICILLIVILGTVNIIYVGHNIVIALANELEMQSNDTNIANIKFDAYFKTNNINEHYRQANINDEINLYMKINVLEKGSLENSKIKIDNSNFKIKSNKISNNYIKKINEDIGEIELNSIIYDNDIELEIPIEFKQEKSVDENYFAQESNISIKGTYIEEDKGKELEGNIGIRIDWTDETDISLEQEIEKCINLGETGTLIQQKIVSKIENGIMPRENEKIKINVPEIEETLPDNINIVLNGEKVEKNVNYNKEEKTLEIDNINSLNEEGKSKWNNLENEYKIIYFYNCSIKENISTMFLDTEINTKIFTKDNIKKTDKRKEELKYKGNVVSVNKKVTKDLYKGYLYADSSNNTYYKENNIIDISDVQSIDNLIINTTEQNFIGNKNNKYNAKNSIFYKGIKINKNKFQNIFGEEGYINIEDNSGNVIETINLQSSVDEQGNINIDYNQITEDIIIKTSRPIKEGIITIQNIKYIKGDTGYSKEQLKTFEKLNINEKVQTNLGVDETEADINLLDTKTEATLQLNETNLSTLKKNENIQFLINLKSCSAEYDLFKNPQIDVIIPKEIKIEVKTITQLNGQEELQIEKTGKKQLENGDTLIRIKMVGEQKKYENNVNQGIQIAFIADLDTENNIPTQAKKIYMSYTNENRKNEEFTYEQDIKLNSKYGVLFSNKLTGYNNSNDIIKGIDNNVISGNLNKNSDQKNATKTINVINNYETEISDVTIIGKIPNIEEEEINGQICKSTFETKLLNNINIQGKDAKIYYSEDPNAVKNSDTWNENYEEVNNPKTFKIDLGEINPSESVEINYQINIPEKLEGMQETYYKNTLNYTYLGNNAQIVSAEKLATEVIENEITADQNNIIKENRKIEENEEYSIQIVAKSGDKILKEGDNVKEGQGVVYELSITNNTDKELKNIQIQATNTNAIYYDTIKYQEDVNGQMMEKIKIEENPELTSKKLEISSLQSGKTETVKYQIAVKEVEGANQKLTGDINVKVDNIEEKTFKNIENNIEQGKLKLTLKNTFSENEKIGAKEDIAIQADVQNLSSEKLENIYLYMYIPKEVLFERDRFGIKDPRCEFIEYTNNIVKLKISSLEKDEKMTITGLLNVKDFDLNLDSIIVTQYFKAELDNEEYISNETNRIITQNLTNISINQTSNNTSGILKDKDTLTFTFDIENKGNVSKDIEFLDFLDEGLKINKVTKIIADSTEELDYNNEEDFGTIAETFEILPKQKICLQIEVVVDIESAESAKITNYAEINGNYIEEQSNVLEFTLEGYDENQGGSGNQGNIDDEDEDEDNSEYKISGQAWLDGNQNGQKDDDENMVSNVVVMLIDGQTGEIAKNSEETELITQTDEDGNYNFGNLKNGKYLVLFQYDTNRYMITQYKKEGVSEDKNSDAISKKVKINNEEFTVGATETLEINSSDIENIDIGFTNDKTFDFRLDKYIKTVIVQDDTNTTTRQYNKQNLVKIELNSKKLASSTVIVEYEIDVTNEGKLAGYANEIVDYLPSDLTFSSEINKDWYQTTDGKVETKVLENTLINPGETKTITLILTKKMTQNNTGKVINTAEIGKLDNEFAVQDIDSIYRNKQQGEDDISTAELIISISTGRTVLYITLVFVTIIIIATGTYFINKKVLKRE